MRYVTKLKSLFADYRGEDDYGNRYYSKTNKKGVERRWVLYSGLIEASKVPSEWWGWLHYTNDAPVDKTKFNYSWRKPHKPNMTGTKKAYLPKGHLLNPVRGQHSKKEVYHIWQPDEE